VLCQLPNGIEDGLGPHLLTYGNMGSTRCDSVEHPAKETVLGQVVVAHNDGVVGQGPVVVIVAVAATAHPLFLSGWSCVVAWYLPLEILLVFLNYFAN
jgi:hypothetical protein